MGLIGRRKTSKTVLEQVLGYFKLVLKALVAQRVARKAYKGYKWLRRLPFIIAGAAIVAFVLRKKQQRGGSGSGSGATATTPSHPSTTTTAAASPPATTPSTPTPTGSPTAVTPAPTAAADGAPEPDTADDGESKT